jgi:hypothetical protein
MEKLLYDTEDIKALHNVLDYAMEQYEENLDDGDDSKEKPEPIFYSMKRVKDWISQVKYKQGFIE